MGMRQLPSVEVQGKRVLVRVDFNAPLTEGEVSDDTRLRAALPTIRHLVDRGARVILMSHLGRPKGQRKPEFSLAPVARRMSGLLAMPVPLAPDCIGAHVGAMIAELAPGQVMLLENLRFHAGETENAPEFAAALSAWADVYVNDAFGTAHRAHASTEGVARRVAIRAPGFLMERELRFLKPLLGDPQRPFAALLGGAKVSGKIDVLSNLLPRVDALLVGGAMMFTFWRARGVAVGRSLVEEDLIDTARRVLERGRELGKEVVLPVDCVAVTGPESGEPGRVVEQGELADQEMGVDIGPATRQRFAERLMSARTIFWNGPMGIFERKPYDAGTRAMAETLARATERGAITVVGGGDSVAALQQMGLAERVTHISTGGGASLEYLEGKTLPGVAALEE